MKTTPKILIRALDANDDSVALAVPILSEDVVARIIASHADAAKALGPEHTLWDVVVWWGDPIVYSEDVIGGPESETYYNDEPVIVDLAEDAARGEGGERLLLIHCKERGFTCTFYNKHSEAEYYTNEVAWSRLADLHKELAARTVG